MSSMFEKQRQERFNIDYRQASIISDKKYNAILGGVTIWGLAVNCIMCYTCTDLALSMNPIGLYIGYFILCFLGITIAYKSDNPVISFIGFNMVCVPMGLIVCISVYAFGGINPGIVTQAIFYTMLIAGTMIFLSIMFPGLFLGLGRALGVCLILNIILSIVMMFIGNDTLIFTKIGVGIFSLYIAYDIQKAQQYPRTVDNAVDCALDLYLDIINLFLKILRILAKSDD